MPHQLRLVSSHICHHSCHHSWSSHFRTLRPVITTTIHERCKKKKKRTYHVLWNVTLTLFFLTVQFPEFEITNGRIGDPHVEHVTELYSDPFRGKWIYSRGDQNSFDCFQGQNSFVNFCRLLPTCHLVLRAVRSIQFLHNTWGGNRLGGSKTMKLLQF